jgi:hypothetical protein
MRVQVYLFCVEFHGDGSLTVKESQVCVCVYVYVCVCVCVCVCVD